MRLIVAALAVALIVFAVWKVIDYREQPPPAPGQERTARKTPPP